MEVDDPPHEEEPLPPDLGQRNKIVGSCRFARAGFLNFDLKGTANPAELRVTCWSSWFLWVERWLHLFLVWNLLSTWLCLWHGAGSSRSTAGQTAKIGTKSAPVLLQAWETSQPDIVAHIRSALWKSSHCMLDVQVHRVRDMLNMCSLTGNGALETLTSYTNPPWPPINQSPCSSCIITRCPCRWWGLIL